MPVDIPTNQGANKKLVVGTMGVLTPATFYSGDKIIGFDIEFIERFAAEYGYEIEFRVEDFVSMFTDTEFGKIDIISDSVIHIYSGACRACYFS